MTGWDIVYFKNENSVEAVPRHWMRKNTCAWPKNAKNAKKYIVKQVKTNPDDFYFYPARRLGNKTYGSLAEAQLKLNKATQKSDLSSTEDNDVVFSKISKKTLKFKSASPKNAKCFDSTEISQISNSCPPRYTAQVKDPSFSNPINYLYKDASDSNSSVSGDEIVVKDSTWNDVNKKQNDNELDLDFLLSPSMNENQFLQTNNDNYKINSPIGIWSVEKNNISPSKVNGNEVSVQGVNRKLFHDDANDTQKSVHIPRKEVSQKKNNDSDNQYIHMSTTDFQNYVINTLNHMKYDISSLINVNSINRINIETLIMEHANKSTRMPLNENNYDIEELIPITNDSQLATIENKIQDPEFRSSLIHKLSLMVGHKDLGNSVRRIMARIFDDNFLMRYSLYGFKKKLPFTKLCIYRVIVDSLRVHVKYKLNTEKDIDVPLGTWLSHAPFRLQSKEKKKKVVAYSTTTSS